MGFLVLGELSEFPTTFRSRTGHRGVQDNAFPRVKNKRGKAVSFLYKLISFITELIPVHAFPHLQEHQWDTDIFLREKPGGLGGGGVRKKVKKKTEVKTQLIQFFCC